MKPDTPSVVADESGTIVRVSRDFANRFGWKPEVLVGRSLTVLIPENLRDAHHLGFSRFVLTGASSILGRVLSLPIVCGDGRVEEAEHFISVSESGEETFLTAVIRPKRDS